METDTTVADRLQQAVRDRFPDVLAFQRAMQKKGVTGSSQGSVYAYIGGASVPSLEFLKAAAEILNVRPEWLMLGSGPRTEEEHRRELERLMSLGDLRGRDVEAAFAALSEEDQVRHVGKRAAIARFSTKLTDAGSTTFSDPDDRDAVLRAALLFLIGVEELFGRVTSPNPDEDLTRRMGYDWLFLRSSSSRGWRTTWEDAVLDLFSRRVKGLGERSNDIWDTHAPLPEGGRKLEHDL